MGDTVGVSRERSTAVKCGSHSSPFISFDRLCHIQFAREELAAAGIDTCSYMERAFSGEPVSQQAGVSSLPHLDSNRSVVEIALLAINSTGTEILIFGVGERHQRISCAKLEIITKDSCSFNTNAVKACGNAKGRMRKYLLGQCTRGCQ